MECYRFSLKALEPDHLWLFGPLNDVDLELKKESVEALSECIQSTRRCPAQLVKGVGEELIPLKSVCGTGASIGYHFMRSQK